jgi:putative phage-type endonuclease
VKAQKRAKAHEMSDVITVEDQIQFVDALRVTEEERENIATLQQGQAPWLASRKGRLTGSKAGAAAGHNPFCSHAKLLKELLFDTFQGNEATRWGTENEDNGVLVYVNWRADHCTVRHMGLCVHPIMHWLAYSPDGLVVEPDGTRVLLEIKCPFKKVPYPSIPAYYLDPSEQFPEFLKGFAQSFSPDNKEPSQKHARQSHKQRSRKERRRRRGRRRGRKTRRG